MKKRIDFTRANIGQLMIQLSVPAFFAIVMNLLYGFVDGVFIGDGIGSEGLGGVSVAFPLLFMVNALASTIGEGLSSVTARLIGRGDHPEEIIGNIRTAQGSTWWFSLLLSVITVIAVVPLMRLMGATSEIHGYAVDYYRALVFGIPFMSISLVYFHQLNAQGEMRIAMQAMILSTVLNIVLDYLAIYIIGMGIKGAGYATAISQVVWFGYMHIKATRSEEIYTIAHPFSIRLSFSKLKTMMVIGIGTFIRQFGVSIALIVMNNLAGIYGNGIHITSFGAAQRILRLFIAPIAAVNVALKPIIGQNYGLGAYDRIRKALKYAAISGGGLGIGLLGTVFLFRNGLGGLFGIADWDMEVFITILLITMALFPLYGIHHLAVSYFVATGKAKEAIVINLLKQLIVLLPLVFILPIFFGVYGIYLAIPITDLLTISFALYLLKRDLKSLTPA